MSEEKLTILTLLFNMKLIDIDNISIICVNKLFYSYVSKYRYNIQNMFICHEFIELLESMGTYITYNNSSFDIYVQAGSIYRKIESFENGIVVENRCNTNELCINTPTDDYRVTRQYRFKNGKVVSQIENTIFIESDDRYKTYTGYIVTFMSNINKIAYNKKFNNLYNPISCLKYAYIMRSFTSKFDIDCNFQIFYSKVKRYNNNNNKSNTGCMCLRCDDCSNAYSDILSRGSVDSNQELLLCCLMKSINRVIWHYPIEKEMDEISVFMLSNHILYNNTYFKNISFGTVKYYNILKIIYQIYLFTDNGDYLQMIYNIYQDIYKENNVDSKYTVLEYKDGTFSSCYPKIKSVFRGDYTQRSKSVLNLNNKMIDFGEFDKWMMLVAVHCRF